MHTIVLNLSLMNEMKVWIWIGRGFKTYSWRIAIRKAIEYKYNIFMNSTFHFFSFLHGKKFLLLLKYLYAKLISVFSDILTFHFYVWYIFYKTICTHIKQQMCSFYKLSYLSFSRKRFWLLQCTYYIEQKNLLRHYLFVSLNVKGH